MCRESALKALAQIAPALGGAVEVVERLVESSRKKQATK